MENKELQEQVLHPFREGKYFVTSIGCIESNLTGSLYANYFKENNWVAVDKPEDADLVICLTCGVTDVKTTQSIRDIQQLEKKLPPQSYVVVAGCIPNIVGDTLKLEVGPKTIIAPTPKDVENLIEREIPLDKIHANYVRFEYMRVRMKAVIAMRRIVFGLKRRHFPMPSYLPRIMDAYEDPGWYYVIVGSGCLHKCAFCAIRFAKGKAKSRSLDMIITEIETGVSNGHKKIVLSGDDIGAYGQDIGTNFVDLLDKIAAVPGDFQIYVRNMEPFWFLKYFDEFFELIKKTKKIRAITIPIQSGNDKILKEQNRAHKIQPLIDVLKKINIDAPHFLLLTHLMVGLPGEDRKAFKESLKLLKEVRFEGIAPDRFYAHPRTASATMDGQVPNVIKWVRHIILIVHILWSVYFNRGKIRGLR